MSANMLALTGHCSLGKCLWPVVHLCCCASLHNNSSCGRSSACDICHSLQAQESGGDDSVAHRVAEARRELHNARFRAMYYEHYLEAYYSDYYSNYYSSRL